MTEPVLLRLDGVSLSYGDTVALQESDLEFHAGESVAVIGHSGSGKSSLLKLASGLINPTTGMITCAGARLNQLSENSKSAFRAKIVGFVYQDYNLIDHLTVQQNVEMAWHLRQHHTTPLEALVAVGLEHRLTHRPNELSGGEQQRVSLARAVCGGPQIVFADEPTGALDDDSTGVVMAMLEELRERFGLLLIVVTHDQSLASTFERKISLESGAVVGDVVLAS